LKREKHRKGQHNRRGTASRNTHNLVAEVVVTRFERFPPQGRKLWFKLDVAVDVCWDGGDDLGRFERSLVGDDLDRTVTVGKGGDDRLEGVAEVAGFDGLVENALGEVRLTVNELQREKS
jgi:hypothetical protein